MSGPSSLPPRPSFPLIPPGSGRPNVHPLPPPPSFDSYRDREPHRRSDMYYFRGPHGADRFGEGERPFNAQPRSFGRGDSYRPERQEFNFRAEPPSSLDLSRAPNPHYDHPPRRIDRGRDHRINGGVAQHDRPHQRPQGNDSRGRGGFLRKAAERPMLQTKRAPTPELMPGMEEEDKACVKYRAVDDMSDSDEADMDLSDGEGDSVEKSAAEEPKKKQARTDLKTSADGDSVPRWSNPDPYTVLPPIDEAQRKKKDFVKLIRKARIVNAADDAPKPEAISDDFISLDFGEEEMNGESLISNGADDMDLTDVPTGPRASNAVQWSLSHESSNVDNSSEDALGSRKRTMDDIIKYDAPGPSKRASKKQVVSGSILTEWQVQAEMNGTPWCTVDHSRTENMGHWLHKEIMDFYWLFKPTDYEYTVRQSLIQKLNDATRKEWKDLCIKPFGSFVAGLFLPTADMDLVAVSEKYLSGGGTFYKNKSFLFAFRKFLEMEGFPVKGSVEVIVNAKVPIVKYVDKVTRLRVDVSFENDTGLTANNTFQLWKHDYPAMPILVTLIKHFLAMRGLNEPVNGGIGGFSVTCLVVSLLQLMPQVQSRNMIPEHHLGEILMEFFDLYGNSFDVVNSAIRLNPPGYAPKRQVDTLIYKNPRHPKLSIIDPNNPYNDIAGGSKNTPKILEAFSMAYNDLRKRMCELRFTPIAERQGKSILGVILEGNYSSFDAQRGHLRSCYESMQKP